MSIEIWPDDEHNRELLDQVHPSDWANPEPRGRYNLVVIGAGTAGLISAAGSAGLGAKVALVERHLMGGDCLNVGCVPSKALIRASRAVAEVHRASEFGVHVSGEVRVDFAAVMERMRRLRLRLSALDSAERFRGLGVDVFLGEAQFTGPDTVVVDGKELRFSRCVIATGGRPKPPSSPGFDQVPYLTNENVFNLTELPRRLAVIGGGPIGCELAQAFARFGSQTTLIVNGHRILGKEDQAASEIVKSSMRRDGVSFECDCTIARVEERPNGGKVIILCDADGSERELVVDQILIGIGRTPNIESLQLEKANVDYDPHGVRVDDTLRTSNPKIFAAGDVCSKFKFTHAADAMARIVIRNALFKLPLISSSRVSALMIPRCTYTDPEIAAVGLTAAEATEQGIPYDVFEVGFDHVDRAVLDGEDVGYAKILVKKGTDRILGATIASAHAGETISEVTLAMQAGVGLKKLSGVIHPYPTQAEAIRKCADAYNRTRLTPTTKWLFQKLLAWRR